MDSGREVRVHELRVSRQGSMGLTVALKPFQCLAARNGVSDSGDICREGKFATRMASVMRVEMRAVRCPPIPDREAGAGENAKQNLPGVLAFRGRRGVAKPPRRYKVSRAHARKTEV